MEMLSQELLEQGLELPLMEAFYTLQEKVTIESAAYFIRWEVAMSAVIGAM